MGTNTTIIIGLAVLVFSIFGSAWLNLRQIERIMESLRNELKAEIKALDQKIDHGLAGVRVEIKALDQKIDHGLAGVKAEIGSLGTRVERVERQLDKAFNLTLK